MQNSESRKQHIEQLYKQYSRGGNFATATNTFRYRRKVLLWDLTIAFSYLLKRLLDIGGAVCALLCFSPIFLATAIAIKLDDGGPLFFSQPRVGYRGRLFSMFKFRSMIMNADQLKDTLLEQNESSGATFKIRRDPRITRVGRVIRRLSIDEFPQFYNVLRGDMSLVGPRPAVPREVATYSPDDRRRLDVKPGITCLWQISGRSELTFQQQISLDVQYIESQSFRTDLLILLKTVPAVLTGKGAY